MTNSDPRQRFLELEAQADSAPLGGAEDNKNKQKQSDEDMEEKAWFENRHLLLLHQMSD